jgi:hypothetical protein
MQGTQNVAQKLTINGVRLSLIVFSSSVTLIFFMDWEKDAVAMTKTRIMITDFRMFGL